MSRFVASERRDFEESLYLLHLHSVHEPNRATLERVDALRALYETKPEDPVPALLELATTVERYQGLVANERAAAWLGELRDPRALDTLTELLLLFDPADRLAAQTLRQRATEALIAYGTDAIDPMLALLAAENPRVAELAARAAAAQTIFPVDPEDLMAEVAMGVLSGIRSPHATEALLTEAAHASSARRRAATLALARSDPPDALVDRVVAALGHGLDEASPDAFELFEAVAQMDRSEAVDLMLDRFARPQTSKQNRRVAAYAIIRAGDERQLAALRAELETMSEAEIGRQRGLLLDIDMAAVSCGADLACWLERLPEGEPGRALAMVKRCGRGKPRAVEALRAQLTPDSWTAAATAHALSFVCLEGCVRCVAAIDEYREASPEGFIDYEDVFRRARAVLSCRSPAI